MKSIEQEIIDKVCKSEDAGDRIIAIGMNPHDCKMVFVNGLGCVFSMNLHKYNMPFGEYEIYAQGALVLVRPEDGDFFTVNSRWFIKNAEDELSNAVLDVNHMYSHEDNDQTTKKVDQ
jgi:hypothetical protein